MSWTTILHLLHKDGVHGFEPVPLSPWSTEEGQWALAASKHIKLYQMGNVHLTRSIKTCSSKFTSILMGESKIKRGGFNYGHMASVLNRYEHYMVSMKKENSQVRKQCASGSWMKAAWECKPFCSCCSCLLAAVWLKKKRGTERKERKKEWKSERDGGWLEWQCAQLHNFWSLQNEKQLWTQSGWN